MIARVYVSMAFKIKLAEITVVLQDERFLAARFCAFQR